MGKTSPNDEIISQSILYKIVAGGTRPSQSFAEQIVSGGPLAKMFTMIDAAQIW